MPGMLLGIWWTRRIRCRGADLVVDKTGPLRTCLGRPGSLSKAGRVRATVKHTAGNKKRGKLDEQRATDAVC